MFKKGVIFVSLISLILSYSFIAPFSISANGISMGAPFVGINFNILDYDQIQQVSSSTTTGNFTTSGTSGNVISMGEGTLSNGAKYYSTGLAGGSMAIIGTFTVNNSSSYSTIYRRVIDTEIILDDFYMGKITLSLTNGSYNHTEQIYVNGNIAHCSFVDSSSNQSAIYNVSLSYDLIQNNDNERWDFPIESFPLVSYSLNNLQVTDLNKYNKYTFPMFNIKKNDILYSTYTQAEQTCTYIFGIHRDLWAKRLFRENFEISLYSGTNPDMPTYEYVDRFYLNGTMFSILKVEITFHEAGNVNIKWIGDDNVLYMPIYHNYDRNRIYVSNDFALRFNLTNRFLNDINTIAQGNATSQESVTDSDTINQQASNTFDQEEQLISNAENDLSNNLQSLDIANKNNNLFGNSKFIASAQWVKTQFDTLTNNNAFGYLITFSLVIGISLVIIGKLRG